MSFKAAFAFWFVMVLIAVGNGFFAEKVLVRHIGDYASHLYKTSIIIAVIFAGSYVYMAGFAGPPLVSTALKTGFFWLSCSIVFEFLFGHYVFGFPWERLLADYRIWEGRLWSLVLASEIAGPLLASWVLRS